MKKRYILIFSSIILIIIAYQGFFSEKSEYVAGQQRHYTLYERYFDNEIDITSTSSYDEDKYNLNEITKEINSDFGTANKIRSELKSLNEKLGLKNTLKELLQTKTHLSSQKNEVDNLKNKLSFKINQLQDLKYYIIKRENEAISKYLYRADIQQKIINIKRLDSNLDNFKNATTQLISFTELKESKINYDNSKQKLRELKRQKRTHYTKTRDYQYSGKSKNNIFQNVNNSSKYQATNKKYYKNSFGERVQSPSYYNSQPKGATAICNDGTYSFSRHRRGTCSGHGGVKKWLK